MLTSRFAIVSLMQQHFVFWAIEWWFRHKLNEVLVYYIEFLIILIIDEVTWSLLLLINIDSINIYIQISYIEYQIVIDIYEVLTKACIYQFIVALFLGRDSTWLLCLVIFIGYKAGLFVLVVICEGGNLSLSDYPLASSKP